MFTFDAIGASKKCIDLIERREKMMKMRKSWLWVAGALLLVSAGSATQSEAVRFAGPPEVVVIPGTYVYMVPDLDVDVLFYQGYWWRPYEGQWYRSRDYRGSWRHVESRHIPGGLRSLPQDYRQRLSTGHERIPHEHVQKNWKKWEKEKHWDKRNDQGPGQHDNQNRGIRNEQRGRD
jgi:hypothetical protein